MHMTFDPYLLKERCLNHRYYASTG